MPHEPHGKCGRPASRPGDGQCHREQTARFDSPQGGSLKVRVKRWGKSPPRRRRRRRHEKPRPVQGKIGGWAARPIATGMPHPPSLRESGATEGRSAARWALREMTTESRASGRNIIRLIGPKTSPFYQLTTVMALRSAAEEISRQREMRYGLLPSISLRDSS